jgi:DNA-binding GntR family transcriptional regulator
MSSRRGEPSQVAPGTDGLVLNRHEEPGAATDGLGPTARLTDSDRLTQGSASDALREAIVRGEYGPGQQLKEEELATRFGVSRTPIREALRQLQAEGLAEYRPNRGVFIPEWSATDREEIFDLRLRLEPYAAELAAHAIAPSQLEELREMACIMEAATQSEDPDRYDRISIVNNGFHRLLASASGRPRLAAMLTSLLNIPLMHRSFSTYEEDAVIRSNAHHREIIDALEARDPEWAAAVVRAHVRIARNLLQATNEGGSTR